MKIIRGSVGKDHVHMGFDTGGVDGLFGVKSSASLIMLQYYLDGSNVTGEPDTSSYDSVRNAANSGITYSTVMTYINSNWSCGIPTIQKVTTTNGYLSTGNMVRVPTSSYGDAYLEEQAAISWAMMVNGAMQALIDVTKYATMGANSGYRTYHSQIEAYIDYRHGGNIASCPYFAKGRTTEEAILPENRSTASDANNTYAESWIQTNWSNFTDDGVWNDVPDIATESGGDLFGYGGSNHGWGLAIDMDLTGSGTPEHNWLVSNASTYGFVPYTAEYWHWDYEP